MKPFTIILVALALIVPSVRSSTNPQTPGTSVATSTRDGMTVQRTNTHAETNPLPAASGTLEQERSRPLPNSGLLNSYVKWISNDVAAIGQDVAISPEGDNEFVGWNLNNVRVSFHENTSNTPVWEHVSDPNTYRNFVALSANSSIVANASYHDLFLFDKNTGAITFNYMPEDNRIAGPTAVSRDGSLLVCVATGTVHRVYAFTPPSATPLWTFDFSDAESYGVYGITLSHDKSTIAVNGKFHGWVLNASNGTVKTHFDIANTESPLALSADASVMAIAELGGFIKAFTWNSSQSRYDLLWQYKVPAGAYTNWASSVGISSDGLTIMGGSLIFLSTGYDGSIYMFDTFGDGTPNWVRTGVGDLVDEVTLSDDGAFGAAVTWGDLANSQPDILIFEKESNVPIFTVNTPGSMFSLSMSADGRSVVAGGKAVHARQFGNGGNVYNIGVDLGGGSISGNVTLSGAPDNSGATVQVVGTFRRATTDTTGNYIVDGVPAGTHTVRMSKLGYVSGTVTNVVVVGGDTTENVNATLAQTGAAPSNLVASHSLNSRIVLTWINPTSAKQREYERMVAADDYPVRTSTALRNFDATNPPDIRRPPGPLPVPPDSIRIYRAVRSGGPYYVKRTLSGPATSYTDSSALPLTDYYYRVTALYGNGESVYSNEAYGTVDSSFLQFSITTPHQTVIPTVDGVLSPGEWTDAVQVDVSDVFGYGGGERLPRGSAFMYFKYDSITHRLYIAGEDFLNNDGVTNSEGFGLYFDDNNNDQFEPFGTLPLLREGNYWAYYFTSGANVRFREIYTNGGVNSIIDTVTDAQAAMSGSTGHFVGEVSIPISFLNKNHLQVFGPDRVVGAGLFLIGRNALAEPLWHGWWPQTMSSVFSPQGFGSIHIPIMLPAPPRAPTNVTVTRQGAALHITWTDPIEGINGDPLSLPVTFQLNRNGDDIAEFPLGLESFVDSSVAEEGWYEYKLRGYVDISTETIYYGPYSDIVGTFAVRDPQLTEVFYDDGTYEAFYVVQFTHDNNKFGIRFTPAQYPAKVYRVKAMTNNGFSPILVSIHADSTGLPGPMLAGQYVGESRQTSGVDSFTVTIPGTAPPTITTGDFWVVLSYLPTSPGAPGIGGDQTAPMQMRSYYYTNTSGWVQITFANLIVRAFITGQGLSVGDKGELPTEFALSQNYPNPFNPETRITFEIPSSAGASAVTSLRVFDVLGREVAVLINEEKEAGRHSITWDARSVASGVYFYRLTAANFASMKKMVVVR